jgi:hypothetical protein
MRIEENLSDELKPVIHYIDFQETSDAKANKAPTERRVSSSASLK